jgi:TatD DNase family protein
VLREERAHEVGGVIHSFGEDRELAFAALDLNFDVSFSATALSQDAGSVREVAKSVPLDRLLVESNAPAVALPHQRGLPGEPAQLGVVVDGLAQALAIDPDELRARTTQNALRRFGLSETKN